MTVKKKNAVTGEIEERPVTFKDLLIGTPGFRTVITILILSMHPLGRGVLKSVGFQFPDEKQITQAAEQAKDVHVDIDLLKKDVKDLKDYVLISQANNVTVNDKLDHLKDTFTGFKVDFERSRAVTPKTP